PIAAPPAITNATSSPVFGKPVGFGFVIVTSGRDLPPYVDRIESLPESANATGASASRHATAAAAADARLRIVPQLCSFPMAFLPPCVVRFASPRSRWRAASAESAGGR